ncbi:unnamed protein product, partial [Adineta steineri]
HDFFAARNLPYGVNPSPPPPPPNREAVQDFFASRNLPYGVNPTSPPPPPLPQNREAAQDFFAARNLPYGVNPGNSAVSNAWNRADYAAHHPPPPSMPMNNTWNQTPQGPPQRPNTSFPYPPFGVPSRGPSYVPPPSSFGALLSQAHRQHLPFAGAA